MKNHDEGHRAVPAEQTAAKRGYEAPAVLSVESLEAVAAACEECPSGGGGTQASGKQLGPMGCCITLGS